uniref:Dynein light chain roadblock-type 2 n=2 Tax=Canis lupus TaxID=9612 RepID=A0A8I3P6M3_CANLF
PPGPGPLRSAGRRPHGPTCPQVSAPGAPRPDLGLRRPGGVKATSGRKSRPRPPPDRVHAGAGAGTSGRSHPPRLLATAGSVADFPGRVGAGLSRESSCLHDGIPIRTTLDNSTTVQYAGLLHQLTMKAKSTVRDIDPQNDLTFLRIRSKKHEIMVAPDKEYLLIVIQNPCE